MRTLLACLAVGLCAASAAAPAAAQSWFSAPAGRDAFRPLSDDDERAYSHAFAAAARADSMAVGLALRDVQNRLLEGYVLRELFLAPGATPDIAVLADWLDRYADLPGADQVRRRALSLRGEAMTPLLRAPDPAPRRAPQPMPMRASFRPDAAAPGATADERARNRAATEAYVAGDLTRALLLAEAEVAGGYAGHARWTAGMAAYRLGDHARALDHFEAGAAWPHGDDWQRTAHAFWAARAAEAHGRQDRIAANLRIAAAEPLTFYGQLALARLGEDSGLAMPDPTAARLQAEELLRRRPAAARAAALAQIGRTADAEQALLRAFAAAQPGDDDAFVALADALALGAVQIRLGEAGGRSAVAALYPVPDLAPRDGFRLDRALIFAVTRQESKFNPAAVSRSGARGLMQLLPSTAAWLAGEPRLREDPTLLYDPTLNLTLGQAYLERLLNQVEPAGCLLHVLLAYNSGPGAVQRWRRTWTGPDDPLLILESYPVGEARLYAEKVLANLWIYHRRLGQPAPSLVALADGRSPIYRPVERQQVATLDDLIAQRAAN